MFEYVTKETVAEYEAFVTSHKNCNFLQASFWARVKKEWDSLRIISRSDDGAVRASMLLLIRKVPYLPYTFLYAPRGPVCDSDCKDGLADLMQAVKEVAKRRRGYLFKADPSVRSDDTQFIDAAKAVGLSLKGSGKNFDGVQPNYVFRLDVAGKSEDELFAAFQSKTRYNIRLAQRKGVTVRLGTREDLPRFHEIMRETGERDNFGIRPLWYFELMYDVMAKSDSLRLYVADYEGQMISGTIAIYYGDKVWYLYGASSNEHRNVMPNYLLQWEMIKWSLEKKCSIYDFRGVSGDLSEDNPLYGLYRFKKGFSGELVEFAGEFEMIFKPAAKRIIDMGQKILKR